MVHGKDKGRAEEAMGKSTGDRRKEAEGKIRQAKGEMKKMSGGHDQPPPHVPPAP